jgi:hypothetical protein
MNVRQIAMSLVVAFSVLFSSGGASASLGVVELTGLLTVLAELRKSLAAIVTQADVATANRIAQIDAVAKVNIDRINGLVQNVSDSTTKQREEAARQAFNVVSEAQRMVDSSGKNMFGGLNESLAAASTIVDALPFTSMPDTVFAVTPLKMLRSARDRQVSVYGYFPTAAKAPDLVSITVDGQPVKYSRSVGKLTFDLLDKAPSDSAPASDIRIAIGKPWWAVLSTASAPIEARIRFVKNKPYTFVIDVRQDNPLAFLNVTGAQNISTANSDNTAINPVMTAAELFRLTVPNLASYDPDTASLLSIVKHASSSGGKPCASCPEPTGRIKKWDKDKVELEVRAPDCGRHVVNPPGLLEVPYVCNGGGSNYSLHIVPTFKVRAQAVPDTVSVAITTIQADWKSVSEVVAPATWAKMSIKLSFDDSIDKYENVVFLTKAVPLATAPSFDVRVIETQVSIATR